jgi:hypothetical protein
MRSLEARLQRLEQATGRTAIPENTEFEADVQCLGQYEMWRARDALKAIIRGDSSPAEEYEQLLELAHTRRMNGWTQADRDRLAALDNEKFKALWGFTDALREGHRVYINKYRFDVLDLTPAEIMQLAKTVDAESADDLASLADVVARLRLDGCAMTMDAFDALVMRGQIAPEPPERQSSRSKSVHWGS